MLGHLIERVRAAPGVVEQQALAMILIERIRASFDLLICVAVFALIVGLAIPRP